MGTYIIVILVSLAIGAALGYKDGAKIYAEIKEEVAKIEAELVTAKTSLSADAQKILTRIKNIL